jgi:regulator of ribonuclease activity B
MLGSVSIDDPTPNPLSRRDAAAVIGILATLEGDLLFGADNDLWRRLPESLRADRLMPPNLGDRAALRIAIANLNQRMRYALGDYDEPPEPDDGLADHHVRFDTADKASAFVQAMDAIGLPTQQLQSAHPETEPFLVMVTTGEPLLSEAFEHKDAQIREAAHDTGGFYEGWGGGAPPQSS